MPAAHPALAAIKAAFPDARFLVGTFRGDTTLVVPRDALKPLCFHLRDAQRYVQLVDLHATDYDGYPGAQGRFAVTYQLLNHQTNDRLWLKVWLTPTRPFAHGEGGRDETAVEHGDPGLVVDSVYDVWPAADWMEREAYDLVGVLFAGHPDLRRILTWNGFGSHPLRKDYPLRGIGEREDYKVITREGA